MRSIFLWSLVSLSGGNVLTRIGDKIGGRLWRGLFLVSESLFSRELSFGKEDKPFLKFCEFDLVVSDLEVAVRMPPRTPERNIGIL